MHKISSSDFKLDTEIYEIGNGCLHMMKHLQLHTSLECDEFLHKINNHHAVICERESKEEEKN